MSTEGISIRINEKIRVKEVRLIGPQGEQLGVVPVSDGLRQAKEYNLDLVEVAPSAKPPVCRIMDFSKYKYEQEKKKKEARRRQHLAQKKEIKLKPNIEEHDYQTKLRHAERFLLKGDKVKFTMTYRGREMMHAERGKGVLNRFATELSRVAELEMPPLQEGRNIIMTLMPKSK